VNPGQTVDQKFVKEADEGYRAIREREAAAKREAALKKGEAETVPKDAESSSGQDGPRGRRSRPGPQEADAGRTGPGA
jgi:hypothetical protein